jgi:hypothetical protein
LSAESRKTLLLQKFMNGYVTDLLKEVENRMQQSGGFEQSHFDEFIEDVVEEWVGLGKIHQAENTENLKEQLKLKWPEVEERLTNS